MPEPFLRGDPLIELITARHVLSHQSGFQNWRTPQEPLKIHIRPGTDFMYSGEGYNYLQSVVTQIKGKVNAEQCGSYEADLKVCATDIGEYMFKNVLIPNGMTSSGYEWNAALGRNVALPHDIEGKILQKNHYTAIDMARYASSGGLTTTARDFSNFIIGLFTSKQNDPDFGIQKSFKNGSRLTFNINDLFNSLKITGISDISEEDVYIKRQRDFSHRTFKLTYSAHFGNQKLTEERERKSGAEEELKRVN